MSLQLREGLSYCRCGDRIILLDLKADRYFGLGPTLEPLFIRWAASPDAAARGNDLEPLLALNLLIEVSGGASPRSAATASPITRDIATGAIAGPRDVAQALAMELIVRFWLRARPLETIIRRLGTAARPVRIVPNGVESRAERVATAFERTALVLGAYDRCLSRALAAMIICRRREVDATLVFGVRINPFGAHCWVQRRDIVIVGDYEQARLFTPILTVP